MKIKDITSCIEEIAPLNYAESFDNVGLLVGKYNDNVSGVLVTLDTLENVVDEYCDNIDGEIEITVTGGTAGYQYIISGDPTTYGPDPNGWTFTGLLAGDYTIMVIDLSGCTHTLEVTIEDSPDFYYETNSVSCNGLIDGEITIWASIGPTDPLSPTAPYTFEISSNPECLKVLRIYGRLIRFHPECIRFY